MFGNMVLHTVKLNNQMRRSNIKINDIINDPLLTINGNWQFPKKLIPELRFLRSHILTKLS